MIAFPPLWQRHAPPDDRVADVLFVCFSKGALRDDVKLRVDLFGVPSKEAMALADVRAHRRCENQEWFDGWRTGALARVAADHLKAGVILLEEADSCQTVSFSVRSPPDFGYIQAAWAIARWMVERGASTVLDVHACRFLDAAAVRSVPPAAPLDVRRELLLVFETDATEGGCHVVHTRGMRKFARPDLVALLDPQDAPFVGDVLGQLAAAIADGPLPARPRHGVDLTDELALYLVPDTTGLADRLGLNNDALVLVDDRGGTLKGLAARLS